MSNTAVDVAMNVRVELARRRVRQTDLAECLGLSQAAVSRRLSGAVPFDVNELAAAAALLGVPAASLLPVDQLAAAAP
jgi:transcriptional regulator with XRE-family HTH domain